MYLVKDFVIYFGIYILCLLCLQMDPNGIVPDETSSANGCNGCLTKGRVILLLELQVSLIQGFNIFRLEPSYKVGTDVGIVKSGVLTCVAK